MIKNYLKKQKGIVLSDAIVAILIIILFVGIITSLMYNIVLEFAKTKVYSQHIDLATDIFEYIEKNDFSDVTVTNIIDYVSTQYENISAGTDVDSLSAPYRIGITITPYSELEGNAGKHDFVKLVTLEIKTELRNQTYNTEISYLKKATIEEVEKILEE